MKLNKKLKTTKTCNTAGQAALLMQKMVLDPNKEHFITLNLNARHIPISLNIVSIGTLNANLVHPREVFVTAIKEHSASMIVAHNHPSGGLEPSEADLILTQRLKDCGNLLGIEVIDHLIMDKKGNYACI